MLAAITGGKQSIFQRFFAFKRGFTEKEIDFYVNVDFVNHVALVALMEEEGRPVIVGGARYIVLDPGRAEIAFAMDIASGARYRLGPHAPFDGHRPTSRARGTDRLCLAGQRRDAEDLRKERAQGQCRTRAWGHACFAAALLKRTGYCEVAAGNGDGGQLLLGRRIVSLGNIAIRGVEADDPRPRRQGRTVYK